MSMTMSERVWKLAAPIGFLLTLGCPAGDAKPEASKAAASAGAASVVESASPAPNRKPPQAPPPWHIPVGPPLPIEPGKGLGPIRFGARLETIERLMGEPCEEKKEEAPGRLWCRYSAQAVEFLLEGGVVTRMQVHRLERPFFPGRPKPDFGIFKGHFESGAGLGMLQSAVRELLGPPKSVRPVSGENPYGTIEVHEYDGFSLEYDRLGPERVVLGGVILTRPARR